MKLVLHDRHKLSKDTRAIVNRDAVKRIRHHMQHPKTENVENIDTSDGAVHRNALQF